MMMVPTLLVDLIRAMVVLSDVCPTSAYLMLWVFADESTSGVTIVASRVRAVGC